MRPITDFMQPGVAAPVDLNSAEREQRNGGASTGRAFELARSLLAQLAPLIPLVASQTKTREGADGWIASWGRQLHAERLGVVEIQHGLALLGELNPAVPFSFVVFAQLCHRGGIAERDARDSLSRSLRAASTGEYWGLSGIEWQAGCKYGWYELRSASTEGLWMRWAAALAHAAAHPEHAMLARQPKAHNKRVSASAETRKADWERRKATAHSHLVAAKKLLSAGGRHKAPETVAS